MDTIPNFEQLETAIQTIIQLTKSELAGLSETELNYKQDSKHWSILECLEHLNRYAGYYNPALDAAARKVAGTQAPQQQKLSWFGKKAIESITPSNTKKQKTFKRMNPTNSTLSKKTIQNFLAHQEELIRLITASKNIDSNKKLVPVEFFKLIRLNIFETLFFMVEHEKRHLQQAMRIKKERFFDNFCGQSIFE